GYDTYPHVDMAERADEACHILDRLMRGQLRPAVALVKPPMLPTSQRMMTSQEPMRALLALAHEIERDGRIVNVTLAGGFPASDVPDAGLSVLVTTTGDADFALASADRLARAAWEVREQFLGGVLTFATAAARIRAGGAADKPWLLVDIGDNPWSGSPRDSAELVRFLIAEQIDGAAVAMVVDPESVRRCIAAGLGAEVDLVLGGKTDALHGAPLRIRGRVRSIGDGRYVNAGPMMARLAVDLGPTVVMSTTGLAIEILITSRAESPIDLNVFRANGIEPTECPLIALKGKGHFRAAFEPIAREVLLVEGPGISGSDLSRLPFKNVARPIWPLDPEVEYE
ncbi:MAG: MlrC C-terminal domain-containing protein, partial [Thermomicrobiales bacterium]